MEDNNSPLANPLLNVLALLLAGTIGIVLTTQNTVTTDPAKSELIINWIPLIIVGINILVYILIYRVRPQKAHLITIGGVIGLIYYLAKVYFTTGL